MRTYLALAFASLSMFAAASMGATATQFPCVASKPFVAPFPEPSQVSGGPLYAVTVVAAPTYRSDCYKIGEYDNALNLLALHPKYGVERRQADGSYEEKKSFVANVPVDAFAKSRNAVAFQVLLPQGSYRVRSYDGDNLLESMPFSVGSTASDFVSSGSLFASPVSVDDRLRVAYGQPSAIVRNGVVYYRGFNPEGAKAVGYLEQTDADGVNHYVDAEALQLSFTDGDYFANTMGFSGDAPWTRVKLSVASAPVGRVFDPGLPITACFTTGGGKSCFVVFDPKTPFKDFDPGSAPFRSSR